jgi:hypothetical protein
MHKKTETLANHPLDDAGCNCASSVTRYTVKNQCPNVRGLLKAHGIS